MGVFPTAAKVEDVGWSLNRFHLGCILNSRKKRVLLCVGLTGSQLPFIKPLAIGRNLGMRSVFTKILDWALCSHAFPRGGVVIFLTDELVQGAGEMSLEKNNYSGGVRTRV